MNLVSNSGISIMGWNCSRIREGLAGVSPAFNNNSSSIVVSRIFTRRRRKIRISSKEIRPIFHRTKLITFTGLLEATKCVKCSSLERTHSVRTTISIWISKTMKTRWFWSKIVVNQSWSRMATSISITNNSSIIGAWMDKAAASSAMLHGPTSLVSGRVMAGVEVDSITSKDCTHKPLKLPGL